MPVGVTQTAISSTPSGNPFFEAWATPDDVPPFDRIKPEHFRPAYDRALAEHEAEIAAIAAASAPPSFANTIAALERSGGRVKLAMLVLQGLDPAAAEAALQHHGGQLRAALEEKSK